MRKIKINDQAIFQLKQAFLKDQLKNIFRSTVTAGAHTVNELFVLLQPELKFLHPITHKELSYFMQARCAGIHLALWQKASVWETRFLPVGAWWSTEQPRSLQSPLLMEMHGGCNRPWVVQMPSKIRNSTTPLPNFAIWLTLPGKLS